MVGLIKLHGFVYWIPSSQNPKPEISLYPQVEGPGSTFASRFWSTKQIRYSVLRKEKQSFMQKRRHLFSIFGSKSSITSQAGLEAGSVLSKDFKAHSKSVFRKRYKWSVDLEFFCQIMNELSMNASEVCNSITEQFNAGWTESLCELYPTKAIVVLQLYKRYIMDLPSGGNIHLKFCSWRFRSFRSRVVSTTSTSNWAVDFHPFLL